MSEGIGEELAVEGLGKRGLAPLAARLLQKFILMESVHRDQGLGGTLLLGAGGSGSGLHLQHAQIRAGGWLLGFATCHLPADALRHGQQTSDNSLPA